MGGGGGGLVLGVGFVGVYWRCSVGLMFGQDESRIELRGGRGIELGGFQVRMRVELEKGGSLLSSLGQGWVG